MGKTRAEDHAHSPQAIKEMNSAIRSIVAELDLPEPVQLKIRENAGNLAVACLKVRVLPEGVNIKAACNIPLMQNVLVQALKDAGIVKNTDSVMQNINHVITTTLDKHFPPGQEKLTPLGRQ